MGNSKYYIDKITQWCYDRCYPIFSNGGNMIGINFDLPILYKQASFRFFEKGEHHITRFCQDNVLLLVFDGVLRFSENGKQVEVHAGEYYIQKQNMYQGGELVSDSPHYLYIHFDAEWTEENSVFPYRGHFDFTVLSDLLTRIDSASHQRLPYNELQYLFLKLLLSLKEKPLVNPMAHTLIEYVDQNLDRIASLSDICEAFHYSKNYIIRIFNQEFGMSPIQYINDAKIQRAMYLLETTSKPIVDIMLECGYHDYPYFYKRFIQKNGISPIKWRKQIQKDPLSR